MKFNIYKRYCSITDEIRTEISIVDMDDVNHWVKIGESEVDVPEFSDDEIMRIYKDRVRDKKLAEIEKLQAEL